MASLFNVLKMWIVECSCKLFTAASPLKQHPEIGKGFNADTVKRVAGSLQESSLGIETVNKAADSTQIGEKPGPLCLPAYLPRLAMGNSYLLFNRHFPLPLSIHDSIVKRKIHSGPLHCLWCSSPIVEGGGSCSVNKCLTLPYATLRIAVDFYKQSRRYYCHKHNRFFRSPKGIEQHFKKEHTDLYECGTQCKCKAFFADCDELVIHQTRDDKYRCPFVPNENNTQRKKRIKAEQKKAKKVDVELKKWGY